MTWRPWPDTWADQPVTSGEVLAAQLARPDEFNRTPTEVDERLSLTQRADYVVRRTEQRLRDMRTTGPLRYRGTAESQQRPIASQHMPCGPTVRRRWPDPVTGELIDRSSDDRGWLDLKPGSGRPANHKPKRLPKLPALYVLQGWARLAQSDANLRASAHDELMLGDRLGSRLGLYFDDVVSEPQDRYRDDHEARGTVSVMDLRAAERVGFVEWSGAAQERGQVRRQQADDDEGAAWACFADQRIEARYKTP